MAKPTIQGTFTVMHVSTNANFDLYTYGAFIIDDNAAGPFTINGETIDVPNGWDGRVIPLNICENCTVLDADLIFLGNPKPAGICTSGDTYSGAVAANVDNTDITYQFQNIKSGKFNRS